MAQYAIFKICYNSMKETLAESKLYELARQAKCDDINGTYGFRKCIESDIYETKEQAQIRAIEIRWNDKKERVGEWWRYNKYINRFIIHECKPNGDWKLTNKERKLAIESKWW